MNNVQLIGRLTAEPELKHTQSGKGFTRFTVAVDRPTKQGEEKQADFINVVSWNKTAEFVSKYFTKGQRIALTGSIRTGSYTDRDGNKRNTFEVWAENVEFCGSKTEKHMAQSQPEQQKTSENKPDIEYIPNDADLPF